MRRKGSPEPEVQAITSAAPSRADDQSGRMVSYLWQMGLRVLCFVLALPAFLVLHWPVLGWVLVGAAAVLPTTAVVIANATSRRRIDTVASTTIPEPPRRALGGRSR